MPFDRLLLVGALLLPACTAAPSADGSASNGDTRTCRTELDCAPGEVCAVAGDTVVCRAPKADDPETPAGPDGQPAPPIGLLEGEGRNRTSGDAP